MEFSFALMSRVFANGPGDRGSIPGWVISKTQKMVLDAALLNTQHYKVRLKWSNPVNGVVPSLHLRVLKRKPLGHPQLRSLTLLFFTYTVCYTKSWRTQSALLFTHNRRENNWIHTSPKWNSDSLVQVLNSGYCV